MIHARGLARTFRTRKGAVEAVSGVDIDVEPGELVGFLGPNGAGKTTTLRMLTTLLVPTAGTATVAGHDLLTDPVGVRREIGYVGQSGGAGPDCLVADELILQGRFYGMSAADARARAHTLMADLDLEGMETRVVSTLSGGQRRRLDIAMGLMHLPGLLSSTNPPPASTRRAAPTCGATSAGCTPSAAPPCSSPRTTSTRPTPSATASS